jgi:hypothetical protein
MIAMMTSEPLHVRSTTIFCAQRWWKAAGRHRPCPRIMHPTFLRWLRKYLSKSLTNQAITSEAGKSEGCVDPRTTCQHTLHDNVQDISSWSRRLRCLAEPFVEAFGVILQLRQLSREILQRKLCCFEVKSSPTWFRQEYIVLENGDSAAKDWSWIGAVTK